MTGHGLDDAVESLRRGLGDVRAMNKCATCECFLGVVAQAAADLKRLESATVAGSRDEFEGWLAEAEGRIRSCQHCEVCVPVGPYQRFREALVAASSHDSGDPGADGTCGADSGACTPRCRN